MSWLMKLSPFVRWDQHFYCLPPCDTFSFDSRMVKPQHIRWDEYILSLIPWCHCGVRGCWTQNPKRQPDQTRSHWSLQIQFLHETQIGQLKWCLLVFMVNSINEWCIKLGGVPLPGWISKGTLLPPNRSERNIQQLIAEEELCQMRRHSGVMYCNNSVQLSMINCEVKGGSGGGECCWDWVVVVQQWGWRWGGLVLEMNAMTM